MPDREKEIYLSLEFLASREVPGLYSISAVSKKSAVRVTRFVSLSLSLVMISTVGGGISSQAVSQVTERPKPVVTNVDKNENASPAALNVQQIPSLVDLPQTPES